PRLSASYSNPRTPLPKLNDGNYWYHASPPNRWTCEGSPNPSDWVAVDLGVPRTVHTVKLYLLDDGEKVAPPARVDLESFGGGVGAPFPGRGRSPEVPTGRRANVTRFPGRGVYKLRAVLTHRDGARSGLSEFEAWGDAELPVEPAPPPA